MKRVLNKWGKFRLGRRVHYLQKRILRAEKNGYLKKRDDYLRILKDVQEKLKHIKE